jgi:hypothetical protein
MTQDLTRIGIITLSKMILEQAAPAKLETDNAPADAAESPFTPAEEKFLGKFDAYGTRHLGIIYSPSDIGIREFITRSGKDLNITPEILLNLLRNKFIKLVPYTGFGRNTDYTIELQLSLNDVAGLGAADKDKAEAGSTASGAGSPPDSAAPPPAPGPEVSWVMKYGTILKESANFAKTLLKSPILESNKLNINVYTDNSRILNRFPKEFIYHLKRMLSTIDKKTKTTAEKERLIADILDNLQANFKLTPKNIKKSFEMHKNQKRLQKLLQNNK